MSDDYASSGPDRLLKLMEVRGLVPLSRSGVYSKIKAGRFPPPVKIGRNSYWKLSDIEKLIKHGAE